MEKIFNREHFSLTKLPLTLEDPILFVVSQWQVNKFQPGLLYLLYRLVPATFFVTTWFMRLGAPSWPIYLSMWGYTLCTLQALFSFLLSLSVVIAVNLLKREDVGRNILKVYPVYWFINVTATTMGFVISTVHWAILFKGKDFDTMNFFIHGVNSIYLMTDLWLADHPVRIVHFIYPLIFAIAYSIFGIIYHSYDKNRGGSGYVYPIIDWDYPFPTTFIVLAIGVLVIFFHVLTFAIYLIKVRIHEKLCTKNDGGSMKSEEYVQS